MEKRTSTCTSVIKCYTFCKMFHNSLYWFQWLSFVHTQAAAIASHPMLKNACCMSASCIIPFIWVSANFSVAKKLTQPIFIPSEQIFAYSCSKYIQFIHEHQVVQGELLFICTNSLTVMYSSSFYVCLKGQSDNHDRVTESSTMTPHSVH